MTSHKDQGAAAKEGTLVTLEVQDRAVAEAARQAKASDNPIYLITEGQRKALRNRHGRLRAV